MRAVDNHLCNIASSLVAGEGTKCDKVDPFKPRWISQPVGPLSGEETTTLTDTSVALNIQDAAFGGVCVVSTTFFAAISAIQRSINNGHPQNS